MMNSPLMDDCDDYWTWDVDDRSTGVEITKEDARQAYFHPNWSSGTAAVRGTRVLNNGRYYWEIQLSHRVFGTSMMFGVATKRASLHDFDYLNLVGADENSWGLSHKGLIFHGGECVRFTKPFQENVATTVGILFDGVAGTLSFYKDGVYLGVAFRNLNTVIDNMYPIISSTAAKTLMTLSLMRKDVVSLQERCRAVIVSQFDNSSEIDKVTFGNGQQLPRIIKKFLQEAIFKTAEYKELYHYLDF